MQKLPVEVVGVKIVDNAAIGFTQAVIGTTFVVGEVGVMKIGCATANMLLTLRKIERPGLALAIVRLQVIINGSIIPGPSGIAMMGVVINGAAVKVPRALVLLIFQATVTLVAVFMRAVFTITIVTMVLGVCAKTIHLVNISMLKRHEEISSSSMPLKRGQRTAVMKTDNLLIVHSVDDHC